MGCRVELSRVFEIKSGHIVLYSSFLPVITYTFSQRLFIPQDILLIRLFIGYSLIETISRFEAGTEQKTCGINVFY